MKRLVVGLALLLSACGGERPQTGMAPPPALPELPEPLRKRAEPLPPITDPSVEGMLRDSVDTDIRYNEVGSQLNALLDAYECIKRSLNERADPMRCFQAVAS